MYKRMYPSRINDSVAEDSVILITVGMLDRRNSSPSAAITYDIPCAAPERSTIDDFDTRFVFSHGSISVCSFSDVDSEEHLIIEPKKHNIQKIVYPT